MEQNIFDVADDISFPWLPAYAETTVVPETGPLSAGSTSRMLETIVEETSSDDDDGRGESKLNSLEDHRPNHPQQQQHQGWSQFDQVWSSAGSDTGSVIRVDTPPDQDALSERDFICPPKRRKQDNDEEEEFLCNDTGSGELTVVINDGKGDAGVVGSHEHNNRKPRFYELDGLEVNEYFMKRHNEPRLRFDEIGHDLFTDSDSLSYASLSRSSSLIQFESLERQLQNESVAVASVPLSGSTPSLYHSQCVGAGVGAVADDTTGSPIAGEGLRNAITPVGSDTVGFYCSSSPGKKGGNLLTASNLSQQQGKLSCGGENVGVGEQEQVALNTSDSELYSSSSVSSSASSGGGSSCNYASDECDLNNHDNTPSPSESQVAKSSSDEADGLVRCPQRCSERRRSLNQLRTKNSIESLSEDSGYCDHLHFNMNNLRVKSKSWTNFGSAENVNMFMEPVQPVDYFDQRHVSFHQENRLSTVCDVDEEEHEEQGEMSTKGQEVHRLQPHYNSEESLSNKYDHNKPEHWLAASAAKTNIHNCTKIDLDASKHSRSTGAGELPFVVTTKVIPPSSSSSDAASASESTSSSRRNSVDSLERHPTSSSATTILDRHHRAEPKPKNSNHRRQQRDDIEHQFAVSRKRPRPQQQYRRRRTIISASSPDLFNSDQQCFGAPRGRKQSQRKVSDFLEYGGVNFTVSSVPECLNLCGSRPQESERHTESLDSFEISESATSSGNYCSWNQGQESIASKNFNLYDFREEPVIPTVVKSAKTVTFEPVARPRVNIRASYANLTALDYGDEEDGNQYYLNRNTFRTSSGTRLGGARDMASGSWDQRKTFDEDDEEERIFPVDGDEKNVFNSLLDEISAHFDRNLSIINDQAEAYEPIAAFLHEQRSASAQPSSFNALVASPPQPPPRRTQIKTNPHHSTPPVVVRSPPTPPEATHGKRTFDQDPTNLVTCYAASLERCTFDPTESTLNLYNGSSSAINHTSDLNINHPSTARNYAPVVVAKREFVSSTPNLNYFHGCSDEEGGLNAHHNSLKNVSCLEIGATGDLSSRSIGILTNASSSKCGLSKGVSFCPIVSEIIWKDNSSELDPDDNASVISNQDFEIDIDDEDFEQDDYDHANLIATQTNTLINSNSVETGLCELINHADSSFVNYHRNAESSNHRHHHQPPRVPTPDFEYDRFVLDDVSPHESLPQQPTGERTESAVDRGEGDGARCTSSASVNNAICDDVAASAKVITAEKGSTMASAIANGVDASRNMIAAESSSSAANAESVSVPEANDGLPPPSPPQQKFVNNNNNLIKNFKNGKAEKKGKTFLSRLSSGFRFSFRGKSKKNKDGVIVGATNGRVGSTAPGNDNRQSLSAVKVKDSGNDKVVSSDFIYIPLKDPIEKQADGVDGGGVSDEDVLDAEEYYLRQLGRGQDQTDRVYNSPGDSDVTFRSDSSSIINSTPTGNLAGGGVGGQRNHVLSGKPPLPKQPPRVVGVSAKRSTPTGRYAHAQQYRASSTPPRTEIDPDESHGSGSSAYYHQYTNDTDTGSNGGGTAEGSLSSAVGRYSSARTSFQKNQLVAENANYFNHIMGSEQKIGLIETNLDTHETVISGKTRSLMELGGPSSHMHQLQVHHGGGAGNQMSGGGGGGGERGSKRLGGGVNGIKDRQTAAVASEPGRPHKSMEFLLDKENHRNVLPPENELQKSHETGTNLSEHQLRVQASLQRLNIPDWYKQYSGKDGAPNQTMPNATTAVVGPGGILRKRNSDVGRWTGLSSKTTSLSSLGSHRSDRSPVMLSPSAHSHHGGQTGFSRWSTSHLNSNQTSPSVSTRGSFTRGGLNSSVISGYSTASTTAGSAAGANSAIRNSFRQPYLGWRSQEKLAQPRTPAERLASSLLTQQKLKEQQQQQQHPHQNQKNVEPVVTPEIQSSIKEVTSAIVHYVNDQTNRHSRSRSTSPSQRCWLESSFVGTKPLDSPQTPMIDNSSGPAQVVVLQQNSSSSSTMAGDHYRYNAGRMNGVVTPTVPTFSLPPEHLQSPGSATLEDVLASLLGLPTETHRSSGMNL
ncbi:uncharacterized protein LOC134213159 isoform X2 [Armigeres subalbatus]|uniref:uncharacterized protein LOC134213159 isoform X2 n=1 Tax=Armigeres subalbatus TaxID=124917 RepID=UPI002ED50A48